MSSATNVAPPQTSLRDRSLSPSWSRVLLGTGILIVVLAAIGAVLCMKFWPFAQKSVVEDLSEASDSVVTIQSYHPTYLPVPGCVLYGVEFRHGKEQRVLITIQKLRIMGSYTGVLRQYVPRIVAEGVRVLIPPFGSNTIFNSQHSKIKIGQIVANGTLVEFASGESHGQPLKFDVQDALLTDVQWGSAIGYRLKLHNPNPPGELSVAGKFGPWADGHHEDTPMSGEYTFAKANLAVYEGIAGVLSSKGQFEGHLKHIDISGNTDTPDFEVRSSGHKQDLRTQFNAYVDATNGDVFLRHVEAKFGRSSLSAEGSIARHEAHGGKVADVRLRSQGGRIEDILEPFISAPKSPMTGPMSLDAHTVIRPGKDPFLDKLEMDGEFAIHNGRFTRWDTQENVERLSAGARGQNKSAPENVDTDLRGKVEMTHGIANFSDLDFGIPGVKAKLHGTYNLESHRTSLHGQMRVETNISNTSSGMKAVILKVMDPFFKKKKNEGEMVPVHILGTYEKPDFGLDLGQKEQEKVEKKLK